jgi:hypothetical protein
MSISFDIQVQAFSDQLSAISKKIFIRFFCSATVLRLRSATGGYTALRVTPLFQSPMTQ